MEQRLDRIPAIPLIANDPYFSVWMPADTLNQTETIHWTGAKKRLTGHITVDGKKYRYLGKSSEAAMKTESLCITPTQTISVMEAGGVQAAIRFWAPVLPDDLDTLSTPITFVECVLFSKDGRQHSASLDFKAESTLCYDGEACPSLDADSFVRDGLNAAYVGQTNQKILCHSGDHITIDWGYLYLAASNPDIKLSADEDGVLLNASCMVDKEQVKYCWMLGYDDIESVNYFGECCKAWYSRDGKTLLDAFCEFAERYDEFDRKCNTLDAVVLEEAKRIGGDHYALIAAAAWRHTFAAHKLIKAPDGQMVFLSKENDSNGCIGTVDVSYPSVPLFLKFCPQLVNALCKPVLEFASMPVWKYDFAPHDVGRYPYATGQVYAALCRYKNGMIPKPYYLYSSEQNVYDPKYQMPVEECGNMLIMLETAISFGASDELVRKYMPLLEKWVLYLDKYGDDPGEQLCTDDFAGHLAGNINLSAKAFIGIACYSRILSRLDRAAEADIWEKRAREMAASWLERSKGESGTALTFDGRGWSMKYNVVWDKVLKLGLLPGEFYEKEMASYMDRINEYGLPLDSRADYTKSDWEIWTASMAATQEEFDALTAPIAHYLKTTKTRVPFSDWYDTTTGDYVYFIGRSVQGGVYMPMLLR